MAHSIIIGTPSIKAELTEKIEKILSRNGLTIIDEIIAAYKKLTPDTYWTATGSFLLKQALEKISFSSVDNSSKKAEEFADVCTNF